MYFTRSCNISKLLVIHPTLGGHLKLIYIVMRVTYTPDLDQIGQSRRYTFTLTSFMSYGKDSLETPSVLIAVGNPFLPSWVITYLMNYSLVSVRVSVSQINVKIGIYA